MHLVPEPRVDKNQRIVTRYVRPFDDQPHKALRVAPTAQIFTDQGEALSQSIGTRLDSEFMLEKGIRVSEVMKAARRLPPEVADALRLALADSSSNCFPHLLASALHNGESPDTLDNIALLFSEYQYQEYEWGATGAGELPDWAALRQQIDAVDRYRASGGIIEPRHEIHQCRLAATIGTDNGNRLTALYREIHAIEYQFGWFIRKRNIIEANVSQATRQADWLLRVLELRSAV
jgi:hypothetical protein